jgi:hypothetical protein
LCPTDLRPQTITPRRHPAIKPGQIHAHNAGRYTALEVKQCVQYVINNARRHAEQAGERIGGWVVDPYSSARWFDGYRDWRPAKSAGERVTKGPGTWLLDKGWRRRGLILVLFAPG